MAEELKLPIPGTAVDATGRPLSIGAMALRLAIAGAIPFTFVTIDWFVGDFRHFGVVLDTVGKLRLTAVTAFGPFASLPLLFDDPRSRSS